VRHLPSDYRRTQHPLGPVVGRLNVGRIQKTQQKPFIVLLRRGPSIHSQLKA
jgi:hypothetical protein